jgi:hypothetical protein
MAPCLSVPDVSKEPSTFIFVGHQSKKKRHSQSRNLTAIHIKIPESSPIPVSEPQTSSCALTKGSSNRCRKGQWRIFVLSIARDTTGTNKNTIQYKYYTMQIQYYTNTIQCKYNTIQYNTIQILYNANTIQYKYYTMQIQYNTVQYNTNTIQYSTIQYKYNLRTTCRISSCSSIW